MLVKNILRNVSRRINWFEVVWLKLQWLCTKIQFVRYSDLEYAKILWKRHYHKSWDFQNPQTLDQIMWFLKVSNRNPLLTLCSDKHRVREYVTQCGYDHILKKEFAFFHNADEIDFQKLPSPCYLKCNHASGMNLVYRRENDIDERHIRWKFNFLLKQNPYFLSREWNYKNITPGIVCEELLQMPDGVSDIPEIQFFCFYGKPKFLIYNLGLANTKGDHKDPIRWAIWPDWNLVKEATKLNYDQSPPQKPEIYEELETCAKTLSRPFPFARVDLFVIQKKFYLSELTFYSGGGFTMSKTPVIQDTGKDLDLSEFHIAEDAIKRHTWSETKNAGQN